MISIQTNTQYAHPLSDLSTFSNDIDILHDKSLVKFSLVISMKLKVLKNRDVRYSGLRRASDAHAHRKTTKQIGKSV